jgi:GNAT superfamily N-acetyltransferase
VSVLRHLETEDYYPIIRFEHFQSTSFVLEQEGAIQGFLIGFQSQTNPAQAYIHAVGTHPDSRGQGIGRRLYRHFFAVVRQLGCMEVLSITSPINKGSIAFHTEMGFEILPGDAETDGVAVTTNYDGRGGARVLFRRRVEETLRQK